MMEKLKNWLIKKLGGQTVDKGVMTLEYWNGICPRCNEHIGTYVGKTPLGKKYVVCGVCGYWFEPKEAKPVG